MTLQTAPPLAIATALSVALHLAALVTYGPLPGTATEAPSTVKPLQVRMNTPRPSATRSTPPPRASHTSPPEFKTPIPEVTTPAPPPAPQPAVTPPAPAATSVPYFPTFALTRIPAPLTTVSPEDWPSAPGAPSGSFQIELDIDAEGRVTAQRPICEPHMCGAAAIYAETLASWRFVPGEILGHTVPSRIQIQFEIGTPFDEGLDSAPIPPPQSPTRQ